MDAPNFDEAQTLIQQAIDNPPTTVLPSSSALKHAFSTTLQSLPSTGLGLQKTIEHLTQDLLPSFISSSQSPNFYGFVTGGSTPAATLADHLVTAFDQNVQVHLPDDYSATYIEDRALAMLCELLQFSPDDWTHRTFTTGATASNVLGLACGRESVIDKISGGKASVADLGILGAFQKAGIDDIQVLTTVPHSSLAKAASIVGLGRSSVKLIGTESETHRFDMAKLEELLRTPRTASIVAISCGEVNTGFYATSNLQEMKEIRSLCDKYKAWLHVDGAFGLMARILPSSSPSYTTLNNSCAGISLADSITSDCHKLLNVPYDCGFFLSKHRLIGESVFQNANAAYLKSADGTPTSIASPLNIGIENSRRFRALPVYATLMAYGREGYVDMIERQVALTRRIAELILRHEEYELLPELASSDQAKEKQRLDKVFIIVLFRAKDAELNKKMVRLLNETGKIWVSGSSWDGKPAARFAVSNWQVDVERDIKIIEGALNAVVKGWQDTN